MSKPITQFSSLEPVDTSIIEQCEPTNTHTRLSLNSSHDLRLFTTRSKKNASGVSLSRNGKPSIEVKHYFRVCLKSHRVQSISFCDWAQEDACGVDCLLSDHFSSGV